MQHLDPETLSGYIDGELSAEEPGQVRAHLDSCQQCHTEYLELLAVSRLVRDLPPYVPRKSAHVLQSSRTPQSRNPMQYARPLAVAALLVLFAITGLTVLNQLSDTESDQDDADQLSQRGPDGTDEDRSSSESVAEAPAAAPDESDQPAAAFQEAQDSEDPGLLSGASRQATEEPPGTGEDAGSSNVFQVRIVLYVVIGAAIVAAAVWLHVRRTRRE